jgi:ABC-type nickel/cobalt efflux system permease component RcnA
MEWLIGIQRWLYSGIGENLRDTVDGPGGVALITVAFLFGAIHALMPGHGKSVLVSYHLGQGGRIADGILNGALLAVTHIGIAAVLVLGGVMVISRSVAAGGRAPAFEAASGMLVVLIGALLLVRSVWPQSHTDLRSGRALAVATGLIPCPLTTFILTYALALGKPGLGVLAVAGLLGGVMLTLVSFAVAAVVLGGRFVAFFARTESVRGTMGRVLGVASAGAVLLLGLGMLARLQGTP